MFDYEKVYEVVKAIPTGKITTYGTIAEYLGLKSGARLIGYALNKSHADINIPAHRVVNRKGLLTGKHHFDGSNLMQQLLENEGIVVVNNQIQNFNQHFWNPCTELNNS